MQSKRICPFTFTRINVSFFGFCLSFHSFRKMIFNQSYVYGFAFNIIATTHVLTKRRFYIHVCSSASCTTTRLLGRGDVTANGNVGHSIRSEWNGGMHEMCIIQEFIAIVKCIIVVQLIDRSTDPSIRSNFTSQITIYWCVDASQSQSQ